MPRHHDALPDLVFGRHPAHGIVATNPKNLTTGTWMLESLGFHCVPIQPTLFALADQGRDGIGRTTRAVALLRGAGYRVDADIVFTPPPTTDPAPGRDQDPLRAPDVAFAEHPRLGVVAALDDHASDRSRSALVEHGWRHNPALDIYALPATTTRDEALDKVAGAAWSLHRSGIQVAVQPRLAHGVAARPRLASAPSADPARGRGAPHASPVSAAALATSPARTGHPDKAPAAAFRAAPAQPVNPSSASSRTR
ncbi:MAG TPA: hypothetical protein DD420_17715 [Streptomyces sp.]|nr:hypothetical protein [Streptomyces sp.]